MAPETAIGMGRISQHFPSNGTISIYPNKFDSNTISLESAGDPENLIDISSVKTVWCRRLVSRNLDYSHVHEDDKDHVQDECHAYVTGLWYFVEQCTGDTVRWVNPLGAQTTARNKAVQLRIANSLGLKVPETLMSNNPEKIRYFYEQHKGVVVFKPFYQGIWGEAGQDKYQITTKLEAEHLDREDAIRLCPGIYQVQVEKEFELRVVVMGDRLIAAKLDSQISEHTGLDWRWDAHFQKMPIEPYTLNTEIQEKILTFMADLGISFGSLDLIVTKNNEIVFLEVNEQGQFLFLEERCPELDILNEFCKFLSSDKSDSAHGKCRSYADCKLSEDYADFMVEVNRGDTRKC